MDFKVNAATFGNGCVKLAEVVSGSVLSSFAACIRLLLPILNVLYLGQTKF